MIRSKICINKATKSALLVFCCLTGMNIWGQSIKNTPVAIATPKGIWLYLGNEIPKQFEYQVLKKQGNSNFKPVATIKFNADLKELNSRAAQFNLAFSDLDHVVDADVIRIRDYAMNNAITDSLFMINLPVTHLLTGTAYFDSDVTEGVTYQYQVKKTGVAETVSNTVQLPAKADIMKPAFRLKQEMSDVVYLQWYVPEQRSLSNFALYRRVYKLGDFEKISVKKGYNVLRDTLFLVVADSSVNNPGYYEYFLKPMDVYGNPGPETDIISAGPMTDAATTVPRYLRARGSNRNHEINLSWKFGNNKYIRGIELYRSRNFDSGYVKIAQVPPTDTSYTDVVPVANEVYFYYMQIQGPFEKTYPSAKISGMVKSVGEKPVPPSETGAEKVQGGIKVYWTYTEPYLKGFFVFRYVFEKAGYEQVSGLIPAGSEIYSFTDSSKSLRGDQEYRYAVKAVDDVDQLSDFSPPATAVPGIKEPVTTPINLSVRSKEDGALLIWDDMSKAEPDLLGYKIYRKELSEKEFTLLPNDTLERQKNYFTDSTALDGKNYSYAVSAIDFYGNESARSLLAYFSTKHAGITPPEITRAVSTNEGVLVGWGQIADQDITSIKIYRGTAEANSILVAEIKPENDQYLDRTAVEGQLYLYRISVITGDGKESIKSNSFSIRY